MDSDRVAIFLNVTNIGVTLPAFLNRIDITTDHHPDCVAIADLNDDGKPDMIVANQDEHSFCILK